MPSTEPQGHLVRQIAALLAAIPHARAAALMGYDGLPVVVHGVDDAIRTALPDALIEHAHALAMLRRSEAPPAGAVTELVSYGQAGALVLQPLGDAYYLAVLLLPQGLVGQARHAMRCAEGALRREL
jgi:predicted regulator of Ras-like GTPase activity (Roadblock/LC7/MglB family)